MGRTVFMLYLISLSGFTSAISNRSMDPLVSSIALEFGLPLATAARRGQPAPAEETVQNG